MLGRHDQVVAVAIVFEVVVAGEPPGVNEPTARTEPCRPVHRGEHDVGGEPPHQGTEGQAGAQIERAAERHLDWLDAARAEPRRPARVAADDDPLFEAGPRHAEDEVLEERLRATELGARHGVDDAHQPRSACWTPPHAVVAMQIAAISQATASHQFCHSPKPILAITR